MSGGEGLQRAGGSEHGWQNSHRFMRLEAVEFARRPPRSALPAHHRNTTRPCAMPIRPPAIVLGNVEIVQVADHRMPKWRFQPEQAVHHDLVLLRGSSEAIGSSGG